MPRGAESRTKTEKKKKCSTGTAKTGLRGDESRTKTEKIKKMFYRGVQNRTARPSK